MESRWTTRKSFTWVNCYLPVRSRLLGNGDVPVGDLGDQLLALGLDSGGEFVTRVELDLLTTVSETDHVGRPTEGATADRREHLLQDRVPVVDLRRYDVLSARLTIDQSLPNQGSLSLRAIPIAPTADCVVADSTSTPSDTKVFAQVAMRLSSL